MAITATGAVEPGGPAAAPCNFQSAVRVFAQRLLVNTLIVSRTGGVEPGGPAAAARDAAGVHKTTASQSTLMSLLLSDLLVGSLPKQVVWNLADPPQRPAALKVLASATNLALRNPGRAGWEGAKIASAKSGFPPS